MAEHDFDSKDIRFLSLDQALQMHEESIRHYGGDSGIRDIGLLESALAQPLATFAGQYLHEDIYSMAAAYLYHIVMNHPFVDGNKRTGTLAAFIFLHANALTLTCSSDELADLTLAVACGNLDKAGIAEFFRSHTQSR